MSIEMELKFRIPAPRLAAVRRAVATRSAQVLPLAAVYFDSPGERLAAARMALRLRREGDTWVQTLKAEGASAMQRLEHNVVVPGVRRPALDLSRHDGSEAGRRLREVLADARDEPLLERYATEVQRTRRVLQEGGARIELALDEGRISAGRRRLPICEIEFELLQGSPQALLDLAGRWVDRFGLVLDVRSKSERGQGLAANQPMSRPVKARPVRLDRHGSAQAAHAAMLASALGQALANASQMAEGPSEPEHLHQLRVGLRRLRSLMRVYAGLAPLPDDTLAPALADLFGRLGAARDQDAMAEWLWPALQAAGAPWIPEAGVAAGAAADDIAALLCAPATQRLWLSALVASLSPLDDPTVPAPGEPGTPMPAASPAALREPLREPLQRLLRKVQGDAGRFAELDDEARHRLRRRIKRLRYAADAAGSLWPARSVRATLQALARAQEPLGEYNDTVVALETFRALAAHEGRAWFVVGWLTARREALAAPCAKALARLTRLRGFWQPR